ncbi:MAG: hypothetical protein Q8R02_18080 [Hyphomonadaceae bacterium]|nr:hypothetical protein [Hyphomonadaceae bacterium]
MATVIELKRGEKPREHERYAMVLVSALPPSEGVAFALQPHGKTFFAFDNARDVASVLARAETWADENEIASVYVRRDRP